MPIIDVNDATEVHENIDSIFAADSPDARVQALRRLFVETLDFDPQSGAVSLAGAPANVHLPEVARRIAGLEGVQVVYVDLSEADLDTNRVRKAEAAAATKIVSAQIADDPLLVFTNNDASQLHFIYPDFAGAQPTLRRLVVERDLPRRTAVQQVANIYRQWRDTGSIHTALEMAFDVEAVTRAFFAEYKRVFKMATESVEGFESSDEDEAERKKLFVQTLFNRLMFVYFLSRKGWLTFGGERDYLNALWRGYGTNADQDNFYNTRLTLLFFSGLNNPQSRNLMRDNPAMYEAIGDVPFLNGGLFQKSELDERRGVVVPDGVIEPILGDLFDRFNFTVMESTPFDIEVAVDPEMLGKVFEKLVTGRRESGAYYTPRPVVSFMCREALKGYLEGQDTGAEPDAIARFVDERDPAGIDLAPARRVSQALSEVTVVDPACGSGAYLLGMMQELIELQNTLYNVGVDAKSLYDLKLEIIQRNLYGVDSDEFAVNIAMLRMWLSLVIEYEGERPEPLPNLDFKVVRGDSLLGPDPGPDNYGDLFRFTAQSVAGKLVELKKRFYEATDDKDAFRAEIEGIRDDLRDALGQTPPPEGALDWRIEFAEVFAQRGGFDVAIANPPYIQMQKDGGRLGRLYRSVGYATFVRTGDVYQLFYERACQFLRPSSGLLAYITSNSWLKAEYGKPLRRYFSENHKPLALLELGKDVFDSAIVDTGVLLLRTGGESGAFRALDVDSLPGDDFPPQASEWGRVRPDGDAPWSVLSSLEESVMDKMLERGTPLGDWDVRINYGIKTGYNKAFIIDDDTRNALVESDPKSADILKPVLRGRDIQRYRAKWAGKWLIATLPSLNLSIDDYPAIKEYLLLWFGKDRLGQTGATLEDGTKARKKTGHDWFELQDSIAYHDEFGKEKLLWIELVDSGRFAYDNSGIYGEATTFVMTGEGLKYLCAALNSSLIHWLLKQVAPTSGMGTLRWKKVYLQGMPIPEIPATEQRAFVRLVDAILEAKDADPDADTSGLEWEIDGLVYDLYGLTEEEGTAIERALGLIHQTDEEEDAAIARAIEEVISEEPREYVSEAEVMAALRAPRGG